MEIIENFKGNENSPWFFDNLELPMRFLAEKEETSILDICDIVLEIATQLAKAFGLKNPLEDILRVSDEDWLEHNVSAWFDISEDDD